MLDETLSDADKQASEELRNDAINVLTRAWERVAKNKGQVPKPLIVVEVKEAILTDYMSELVANVVAEGGVEGELVWTAWWFGNDPDAGEELIWTEAEHD